MPGLPVVTTEDADWQNQVRKFADGEALDVMVDPVGGELATDLLGLLADGGTIVFYGGLADEPITVPLAPRRLPGHHPAGCFLRRLAGGGDA
ncbi:zinc-binding dehydrogenase [Actinacidiphila glaucinigra]|uniref:zinc-binding dehydrogenase n=1 Tax=Actinacidiphila glaucinigra TaxID=235986 RepID=UPI00339DC9FA